MRFQHRITPSLDTFTRTLKGDVRGARRAGMINIVSMIEAVARKGAPVKRSNLANSGSSRVEKDGSEGVVTFSAPYAKYVHEGTGLYGPHKTKIVIRSQREITVRPKRGKPYKTKGFLFAPGMIHPVKFVESPGMQGTPFLTDAAEGADMEKLYIEGANNYLAQSPRPPGKERGGR
ncbi:MAG: hypothetical protein QME27_05350 [Syntrophaceae bacterium]|nr:hypothetical protein [Syntrophaceae bacterium]